MPSTTKFKPTEARGTALAEEVLAAIEAEEAYNERKVEGSRHKIDKRNAWAQHTWGEIYLDSLPAGTEIELVEKKPSSYPHGSAWLLGEHLAVIDSGVSCGTAMCFAGHAVTLVGDRMLFSIDELAAAQLKAKGLKANVKRFANKFLKEHSLGISAGSPVVVYSEYVLTREGKIEKTSDRARKLLKLSSGEAEALFGGRNDLWDLRGYVQRMRDGFRVNSGQKVARKR